jgi:hypothetical protein
MMQIKNIANPAGVVGDVANAGLSMYSGKIPVLGEKQYGV